MNAKWWKIVLSLVIQDKTFNVQQSYDGFLYYFQFVSLQVDKVNLAYNYVALTISVCDTIMQVSMVDSSS